MPSDNSANPSWSSRPAFYLASIGAAVGLGSIWRLPYLVGSSGGSAFIVVFVLACLLIATPLLVAEFAIGRRSQRCPADAAGIVALQSGLARGWNAIGIIGTVAVFAVMSYYTVVAGWVLAYTWKCASGALSGQSREDIASVWQGFLASPLEIGAWHLLFLLMVAWISARGVGRGIEVATKVRAPVLLVLLIILATYALATGDVRQGLDFAFSPDIKAITPAVVLAAVGQAFFATGVGLAMMLAYGAYVSKGTSLVRSALATTGSILLVSLLATLMIFPLVFQYGMDPAQGPELVFDVLATAFAEMPGGRLFGTLFFVLLVFAALTPSLAGMEPVVAWLQQHWQLPRGRAVAVSIGAAWMLGIGTVLSFNVWSGWHPLGFVPAFADKTFFEVLDFISSNILPALGALLTSVFMGWRLSRAIVNEELAETTPFARKLCVWLLRYVCPIAITTMLISALATV